VVEPWNYFSFTQKPWAEKQGKNIFEEAVFSAEKQSNQ